FCPTIEFQLPTQRVAGKSPYALAPGELSSRLYLVAIGVWLGKGFVGISDEQPFISNIGRGHPEAVINNSDRSIVRIKFDVDPSRLRIEGVLDQLEYRDELVGDEVAADNVLQVRTDSKGLFF